MSYADEGVPLVVLAGKEYGSGSSRDWAAKGTTLLGVRAVIAESFERIHRSNLIGMGVLPLQFPEGESIDSLGLTGEETFDVGDLQNGEAKTVEVTAHREGGDDVAFEATVRHRHARTRSATSRTAASCTGSCATCAPGRRRASPRARSGRRGGAAGGRGSTRPAPRLRVGSQGGISDAIVPGGGTGPGTSLSSYCVLPPPVIIPRLVARCQPSGSIPQPRRSISSIPDHAARPARAA